MVVALIVADLLSLQHVFKTPTTSDIITSTANYQTPSDVDFNAHHKVRREPGAWAMYNLFMNWVVNSLQHAYYV
jgi:hypothetical protein